MKSIASSLLIVTAMSSPAFAGSQVQVYGLLDVGLTRLSNSGGQATWLVDTGVQQANRLGFRGEEDLGGGQRALFVLESGFALDTGMLGQGGLIFGRQAWLGLQSPYGVISLGRQYDFMVEELANAATAANIGGLYAWHLGDVDRIAGERLNNALKYQFKSSGGFNIGVLYSLGEVAGASQAKSGWSAGLGYSGDGFSLGLAYTQARDTSFLPFNFMGLSQFGGQSTPSGTAIALDKTSNLGVAATYRLGAFNLRSVLTWTRFETANEKLDLKIYEAGLDYRLSPNLLAGFGYAYSQMTVNHWHQFNMGLDYNLSKRSDVYMTYGRIDAAGGNVFGALPAQIPSSTAQQAALRVGLRTKF